MISRRTRVIVPLAVALALLAGPALSGCSIQGIVGQATGGKVDLGGKSVPKDFPSSVPLVKGDIVYGAAVGDAKDRVWNVTVAVAGAASFDEIASQLTGAGFTAAEGFGGSTADGGTGAFDNDTLGVLVVVAKADGKWNANYTVTTKNDAN